MNEALTIKCRIVDPPKPVTFKDLANEIVMDLMRSKHLKNPMTGDGIENLTGVVEASLYRCFG